MCGGIKADIFGSAKLNWVIHKDKERQLSSFLVNAYGGLALLSLNWFRIQ